MKHPEIHQSLKQLHCCVVMATYNNEKSLAKILNEVLTYTTDVIVVNDGSTDSTNAILLQYPQITLLHFKRNKGKGRALKEGFKKARALGFNFAITLDTDGQHFPDDIPVFVEALKNSEDKNIFFIGDRNMNHADVLAKSAKGNRISTFWVRTFTGLNLQDSQSGFRLYPIKQMDKIRWLYWTNKFEFETEVIIKNHWRGTEVKNIPIKIVYPKDRVSHFRPFKDIARITILLIGFLITKGFYIIPRDYFRKLKKKGFRKFFIEDFLQNQDTPKKKALSIALGVFLGLSPLWGFHTVIVICLAILLKLNKVIAFAFSNISLPPFIPFVLFASVQTGNWVMGQNSSFTMEELKNFDAVKHLESYLIGSITLSISAAVLFGFIGYIILKFATRKKVGVDG